MFLAGRTPAVVCSTKEFPGYALKLEAKGYELHHGLRIVRSNELEAWKRDLSCGCRQIHVQVLLRRTRGEPDRIELYAHTEPKGYGLKHFWAALTDRVSYQHGARILREDLGLERSGKRAA
jgi:hypothetical protein